MPIKTFPSMGVPVVEDWNTYAANPALQYISTTTLNANVTTISSVFSSTYDVYRLEWSNMFSTATTYALISLTGGTGVAHYDGIRVTEASGTVTLNGQNGTGYWVGVICGSSSANGTHSSMDMFYPALSVHTLYTQRTTFQLGGGFGGGMNTNNVGYTGFTVTGLFGSVIQGTLRIYGYRKV
jgi:hypothetical protein